MIGAFGVCQRQISAILVTGVMYLLAGILTTVGCISKRLIICCIFLNLYFSSFCIVHAYDYTFQTSKGQVLIR
jgi:hypothetical protein